MRQTSPTALALLLATSAHAFKSTSPFFLLSTEPLRDSSLSSAQLSTAQHVQEGLLDALSSCSADLYVVVSQPGLSAADFQENAVMPMMRKRVLNAQNTYKGVAQISEVVGEIDAELVIEELVTRCGIESVSLESYYADAQMHKAAPAVAPLRLPVLHVGDQARKDGLEKADTSIEKYLEPMANSTKHAVIFISSPPSSEHYAEEAAIYEMDEPVMGEALHMDLKRAISELPHARKAKNDHQRDLPLFERYQFLSPGIFMGLAVAVLLFGILYVGISAIAGLEVSYGAFSKEMGPAAQNKNKAQ